MSWTTFTNWRAKPTTEDFEVSIVSKHPEFDNRPLRQYTIDGISTIGVFGSEPFELHLKNNASEDISAVISLDGISTLTGKEADLDPNQNKWIVRARGTLHLKAWHENSNGGARLVFASADKSVALHATGNISHKGIIAVAIFTEGDRSYRYFQGVTPRRAKLEAKTGGFIPYPASATRGGIFGSDFGGASYNAAEPRAAGTSNISEGSASPSMDFLGVDRERSVDNLSDELASLKKEAAIGAGEYTDQKTHTVAGLRKPELHSIQRIRYMWWDDLVAAVKNRKEPVDAFPTGFPNAKIKSFADLSMVPRVESTAAKNNCVTDGVSRF